MKKTPGAGFIILISSYSVAAIFFLWAWKTPDLEIVWQSIQTYKSFSKPSLTKDQEKLLTKSLQKYPQLRKELDEAKKISAHSDFIKRKVSGEKRSD